MSDAIPIFFAILGCLVGGLSGRLPQSGPAALGVQALTPIGYYLAWTHC